MVGNRYRFNIAEFILNFFSGLFMLQLKQEEISLERQKDFEKSV